MLNQPTNFTADRHLIAILLLACLILLPRGLSIAKAHSEFIDASTHLDRGIAHLRRAMGERPSHDPSFGDAILAAPAYLTGSYPRDPAAAASLHGQRLSAQTLQYLLAAWAAVLMAGFIAIAFAWVRQVYGVQAAWFAAICLLIEPSMAAYAASISNDALGAAGIVTACFVSWKYFEQPTLTRLIGASIGVAAAMSIKNSAIVVPASVCCYAALWWAYLPWRRRESFGQWRAAVPGRLKAIAAGLLVFILAVWAMTLFDFSPVIRSGSEHFGGGGRLSSLLHRPWPGGIFLRSFISGYLVGSHPHHAYLLGEKGTRSWWFYFPVVASFKTPLGLVLTSLAALASIRVLRPRWQEWGLLIPAVLTGILLLRSHANIGYRHALPEVAFILLLITRTLASRSRLLKATAWVGLAAATIDVCLWHPDYTSYINFPRHRVYLAIADASIDAGESLKQVRSWVDAQPGDRPIYDASFGDAKTYLQGSHAIELAPGEQPTHGLIIITPFNLVGIDNTDDPYAALRSRDPIAIIGHNALVYDLDQLAGGHSFAWPRRDK